MRLSCLLAMITRSVVRCWRGPEGQRGSGPWRRSGWPASPPGAGSTTPCHDACILDRYRAQWLNLPMATVWLRLRADIRLGWRTLAALALLLGLVGGVVLTAAAGARRTDTAYPRLLSWASATQVDILPFSGEPAPRYYAAVARLPQAAAVSAQILYQIALPARHGAPQLVEAFSSPDGTMGVSADRVKILQGRMFTSRAPGQAVIDPQLASLVHL